MKALPSSQPADEELEPLDVGRVVRLALGQRRELDRVVDQEGRLDQVGAHECFSSSSTIRGQTVSVGDVGAGCPRRGQQLGLVGIAA